MDDTFIPLADMDEWTDFWADNGKAIAMEEREALSLACNQCLMVGGGASPLFRVGFVDSE